MKTHGKLGHKGHKNVSTLLRQRDFVGSLQHGFTSTQQSNLESSKTDHGLTLLSAAGPSSPLGKTAAFQLLRILKTKAYASKPARSGKGDWNPVRDEAVEAAEAVNSLHGPWGQQPALLWPPSRGWGVHLSCLAARY